jgi:hypothetical protein
MQKLSLFLFTITVFGAGYLLGSTDALTVQQVNAAAQLQKRMSSDALLTYRHARIEIEKLSDALAAEKKYLPATDGDNFFSLLVGGVDALRDLEEGRGVDPETFAGLYAGRALPEVTKHLERDENGRIRYKGNIVRLYSQERLKQMFRLRDVLVSRAGSIRD